MHLILSPKKSLPIPQEKSAVRVRTDADPGSPPPSGAPGPPCAKSLQGAEAALSVTVPLLSCLARPFSFRKLEAPFLGLVQLLIAWSRRYTHPSRAAGRLCRLRPWGRDESLTTVSFALNSTAHVVSAACAPRGAQRVCCVHSRGVARGSRAGTRRTLPLTRRQTRCPHPRFPPCPVHHSQE